MKQIGTMGLFLAYAIVLFFCLRTGMESKPATEDTVVRPEITVQQTQIEAEVPEGFIETGWLRSYLFMLKILEPVKQWDLPVDYDKYAFNPQGKFLSARDRTMAYVGQRTGLYSKFGRLLSARYLDRFYIYSLEKMLI